MPSALSKRGKQLAAATALGGLTIAAALGFTGWGAVQASHHPVRWVMSTKGAP